MLRIWFVLLSTTLLQAAQVVDVIPDAKQGLVEVRVRHFAKSTESPITFQDTVCLLKDTEDKSERCAQPSRIIKSTTGPGEMILKLPYEKAHFSTGEKVNLLIRKNSEGTTSTSLPKARGVSNSPVKEKIITRTINKTKKRSILSEEETPQKEKKSYEKKFNIAAGFAVFGKSAFVSYFFQLPIQFAASSEFSFGVTPLFTKQNTNGLSIQGFGALITATIHFQKFLEGARLQGGIGFTSATLDNSLSQEKISPLIGTLTLGFTSLSHNSGVTFDIGGGALYINPSKSVLLEIPDRIYPHATVSLGFAF